MLFETFSNGIPAAASVYAANLGIMAIYLGVFLFPVLALAYACAAQERGSGSKVNS